MNKLDTFIFLMSLERIFLNTLHILLLNQSIFICFSLMQQTELFFASDFLFILLFYVRFRSIFLTTDSKQIVSHRREACVNDFIIHGKKENV